MQQNLLNEIEQAFLGSLLVSERAYDEHVPRIRREYFHIPVHARIFDAISRLREEGKPVVVSLLAPLFANDPDLLDVGGGQYIAALADSVISSMMITVNGYAEKIHGEHCRRAAERLARQIQDMTGKADFTATGDLLAIETLTSELVANLTEEGTDQTATADLATSVGKALTDIRTAQLGHFGIKTGIGKLDGHLRGLMPRRLYVVAARPGMGKTAFAATVAFNAAQSGKKVLFFSIEMSESDIAQRILARKSGISVDEMNTPHRLSEEQEDLLCTSAEKIHGLPLKVEQRQFLTPAMIVNMARRHKRKHGLDLLVIDYLGLLQVEDKRALKVHQIEEITTGLKRAANTLGIPIILLAQLNRSVEQRDDKRPQLSDLRDSGSIEQDADVVIFLYREEVYLRQDTKPVSQGFNPDYRKRKEAERFADIESVRGKAEIIIAKNRQGRTGIIPARFDGERQAFHE